ncbi:MAG: ABC transporter permease [Acidimicrobiia bacterium]|nr:ABC transporter permease [Acidimicrobiia bacterium]
MSVAVEALDVERIAETDVAGRAAAWKAALRKWPIALGAGVIVLWVLIAVTVPLWSPSGFKESVGPRLQSPNASQWLGTDANGRDVLVRTLYGARESLPTAAAVIVLTVLIGSALGALAGFRGGLAESFVMRISDVVLAFPPIFLAMAVAAALGPGLRNTVIALVLVWWPIYARLLRGQVLTIKNREHVEAAVAVGVPRGRILRRHVLPLAVTPVLINATMDFGQVVILTASLSFLGLGATPPSPEWGLAIDDGTRNFYQWWISLGPGLAILSIVMAANFLGDGLRDHFDVKAHG